MLSTRTISHLNSACEASNIFYEQGGLIYLYTFGYNRAHSFIEDSILNQAKSKRWFEEVETGAIELFFEKALFHPFPKCVSSKTKEFVNEFLVNLQEDFIDMYAIISSHDTSDDICNILTLSFIKGDSFHSLELFWSVD